MSSYSTKAKKVDGKLEKMAKRRVPVNPKYANVKSSLDTGASLSKYLDKLEEIRSNYRFQKNEIFKRMKVTTFAQLIIQVERFRQSQGQFFEDILEEQSESPTDLTSSNDNDARNGNDMDTTPRNQNKTNNNTGKSSPTLTESEFGDQPSTQRSTLHGLICGVGEKDTSSNYSGGGHYNSNGTTHSSSSNTPSSVGGNSSSRSGGHPSSAASSARGGSGDSTEGHPFLLLDCQDEEDFEKCHIVGAINFPKSRLSRAVNYEIAPMYDYKNKAGKVIVVYDADEQIAVHVVTSLVERGYDNLFMLSGGLKVTYQKVPTLITGTLPKAALVFNENTARPAKGGGSKKGSVASEIQLDPVIRSEFSSDDIDRIEDELGNTLEGRSTAAPASSRSSRASVASSHRSSGAGDGQNRWK
ncbi:centrosomal protein of 41 kDa-like isoform X2 [Symsagittifera roscoffensis]|uniref:centrosomal protein of 41 kDa-like isoform X2 n=1 Tax=Symsagittifera roscoffensis TaxID=84072 RepID=UPI00307BFB0E